MNYKKLTATAITPKRELASAGYDLFSDTDSFHLYSNETEKVSTSISVEIPEGHVGLIYPKSGLGTQGIVLGNLTGVIDADYRGEIIVQLWNRNLNGSPILIQNGQKVAQLVIMPIITPELVEVNKLEETTRGDSGFGSTGV